MLLLFFHFETAAVADDVANAVNVADAVTAAIAAVSAGACFRDPEPETCL